MILWKYDQGSKWYRFLFFGSQHISVEVQWLSCHQVIASRNADMVLAKNEGLTSQ